VRANSAPRRRRPRCLNAAFDWAFVNYYFQHYLDENPFGFGGIDIKSYFMGMSGRTWDNVRSSRIPSNFKGSASHTHNALDDAIEQGEMFRRMAANVASKNTDKFGA
jgi:ribonuclease T